MLWPGIAGGLRLAVSAYAFVLATKTGQALGRWHWRWFGIGHLDVRLGSALLAVFGLDALAALWLSRARPAPRVAAAQEN